MLKTDSYLQKTVSRPSSIEKGFLFETIEIENGYECRLTHRIPFGASKITSGRGWENKNCDVTRTISENQERWEIFSA
ncbi:predicted protein [Sclerotinia sclerotiorum 1980 UF-70]|uniref:Uncharacterized protein n=1 Tax=Sclerotinia sclerotiorum (strain ATCC 18683 / 1980 / Ss-1) TaxID=665079 RepID=A7F8I2_SCLS1|nr:predicted protein [Sclerotinia sclerotiorum 1980 UF-70]EDN99053.1 predicted protein [Sclerotinia sclerotiorum 1980 UF-70]